MHAENQTRSRSKMCSSLIFESHGQEKFEHAHRFFWARRDSAVKKKQNVGHHSQHPKTKEVKTAQTCRLRLLRRSFASFLVLLHINQPLNLIHINKVKSREHAI